MVVGRGQAGEDGSWLGRVLIKSRLFKNRHFAPTSQTPIVGDGGVPPP